MAGRRRIVKIGPPTRGLTDFPEHASPEHSTQALNVEYVNGGVSTRRGTQLIQDDINGQPMTGIPDAAATVKLVKHFRLYGDDGPNLIIVGYVPRAGALNNHYRLFVKKDSDWGNWSGVSSYGLTDGALNGWIRGPESRWDSCPFRDLGGIGRTPVVCTDHRNHAAPSVFYWDGHAAPPVGGVAGDFVSLVGVNRTVDHFHQGELPDSPYSDDPGSYVTQNIRARFCRSHKGRLVLANIDMFVKEMGFVKDSALWFSNLGDVRGWPLENIHVPTIGDSSPITGIASRADHIIVFRHRSISLFRVDSPSHQVYREVESSRGCIAHGTIIDDVEGMTMFLSSDGFYGFDGRSLHHLSAPISRTMLQAIEGGDMGGAHAVHYPKKRQVWLSIPMDGGAPRVIFVMDYRFGHGGVPAWSMFEFQASAWNDGAVKKQLGGFATNERGTEMYGVTQNILGELDYERFDYGDSADHQDSASQSGYRSRWESGPVDYGMNSVKRWRYIRPMVRPTMDSNVTAWWRLDEQPFDGALFNSQSVTFAPDDDSGGAALGAFVLGTSRLGGAEDHGKRLDVHSGGLGRYGRIGIQTDNTARHKFDVRGAEIDTLQRPRARR